MYTFVTMKQLIIVISIFAVIVMGLCIAVFKQHKDMDEMISYEEIEENYVPKDHFKEYCDAITEKVSDLVDDRIDDLEKEIKTAVKSEVRTVVDNIPVSEPSETISEKEIIKKINKKMDKKIDSLRNEIGEAINDLSEDNDYNSEIVSSIKQSYIEFRDEAVDRMNELVLLSSLMFDEMHPNEDVHEYINNCVVECDE